MVTHCRVAKERLLRPKRAHLVSFWRKALCVYLGHLFIQGNLKMYTVELQCSKVKYFKELIIIWISNKWSFKMPMLRYNLLFAWLILFKIFLLFLFLFYAAAISGDDSPLKMREKLYLLAVGYFRSGDYSRSRELVEECLTVWYHLWLGFFYALFINY